MPQEHKFIPLKYRQFSDEEMQKRGEEFYRFMNLRRTVREFSPKPIPEGIIENAILTAGTSPSGAHKQPWFFCVVRDSEIKHKIRIAAEQEEKLNYESRFSDEWLEDLSIFETDDVKEFIDIAPVLIVIFKQSYRIINGEKYKNYYVNESAGIAAGTLITALHNAGLATLTHTPSPMKFLSEILGRPQNETPIILMPVGYPKEGTKVPDLRRKSLDEIMKVY